MLGTNYFAGAVSSSLESLFIALDSVIGQPEDQSSANESQGSNYEKIELISETGHMLTKINSVEHH